MPRRNRNVQPKRKQRPSKGQKHAIPPAIERPRPPRDPVPYINVKDTMEDH